MAPTQAADAPAATVQQLYQTHCAACHGTTMQGAVGPTLGAHTWLHGAPTKANLVKVIAQGVPEKNMPSWSGTLNATQIEQLAEYIAANASKPAVAVTPAAAAAAAAATKAQQNIPDLNGFKLPKGFHISVYADQVAAARSMVVSESGIVYVGSR
ncbi:MAG: cytochrome c, partial [Burkholderiaceae bacterium]|nr:cytochrome c [Burkholderiaceae bacterium]